MSGFVLAIGPQPIARLPALRKSLQRLSVANKIAAEEVVYNESLLVCSLNNATRQAWFENELVSIYLYGTLYGDHSRDDADVQSVYRLYLKNGGGWIRALNGSFVIVFQDKREGFVYVITDRIGSIPVYWHQSSDRSLFLSTETKTIRQCCGTEFNLQMDNLLSQFSFGRVKFTREPLFQNIHVINPGHVLRYDKLSHVSQSSYFLYRPCSGDSSVPNDDRVETASEVMRHIVNRAIEHASRIALCISGGLDSRTILACVNPEHYHKVLAVSFGMQDNNESRIAKAVTDTLGMRYLDIVLTPQHFIDYGATAIDISEGQDLFVQGYLDFVSQLLSTDYGITDVLDGMEIGVSLGGDYLRAEFHELTNSDLPKYLLDKFFIHRAAPTDIFCFDVQAQLTRIIANALQEIADIKTPYDKLDTFYVECYTREAMRLRHRLLRKRLRLTPLTSSNEYLNLVLTLPGCVKQERAFQLQLLERLNQKLLHIPYHATMLPLIVPRQDWELGQRIIAEQEALCQRIWSKRRVNVPFPHYYSNFAEWLRSSPPMISYTNHLLLSSDTQAVGRIVKKEWVDKILNEHRHGAADHRTSILYLMSLELFLRSI
jgi:Asparagine synthase/Glutamine amidotransferase domain